MDAKYYAGTQTMNEARHVEVFSRYLHDKIEWEWPINENLKELSTPRFRTRAGTSSTSVCRF